MERLARGDSASTAPATVEEAAPEAAPAKANGHGADGFLHRLVDKVKDEAIDLGGAAIGVAELAGLRYPVHSYSSQVSSELVRGARVDAGQMAALKQQYGIRGIVNLCLENNDDAAPAAQLGLVAKHIPILDNTAPKPEQVRDFLAFVQASGPVYVHCEAGQGRTGTMVGCYRISSQGWSADQAIAEAKQFGMKVPAQMEFLRHWAAQAAATPAPVQEAAAAGAEK